MLLKTLDHPNIIQLGGLYYDKGALNLLLSPFVGIFYFYLCLLDFRLKNTRSRPRICNTVEVIKRTSGQKRNVSAIACNFVFT